MTAHPALSVALAVGLATGAAARLAGAPTAAGLMAGIVAAAVAGAGIRTVRRRDARRFRESLARLDEVSGATGASPDPGGHATLEETLHSVAELRRRSDRRSERLRRLFEVLPLGLMRIRASGRIGSANARARRALGIAFDPGEHPFLEVIRRPAVAEAVQRALREREETYGLPHELPGVDEANEIDVRLLDEDVLLVFHDITRLRELERARRQFLVDVSHELRTPLTSIRAFTETLLEGGLEDDANRAKFVRIVLEHAVRMEALLDDVSELARMETPEFALERSNVILAAKAERITESLRTLADGRSLEIEVRGDRDVEVSADPRRVDQILTNLIENAIKFNRNHGRVEIAVERRDGGLEMSVSDTGVGIAQADLPRIFHRFFRVDKARKTTDGTGLGLAIVKHLVRSHGWSIDVESQLGEGTTFRLRIPPDQVDPL